MADQVSTLGLAVDTSGLKQADTALGDVTQAGEKTSASLGRVESLLASIDASSRSVAKSLAAAAQSTRDVGATSKAADDAGRRLIETLREQVALYGKSAEDVLRYKAALAGVGAEAAPLILQLQNQRAAQQKAAESALAEAQAQREAAQAKATAERAQQGFLATLREQVETMGKSRAELLAYRAAQLGVTEQAAPLIQKLSQASEANQGLGVSSKLAAFQTQQLAFQLNDLFVQVASGGSPLTALIQQGSQLAGTFGGVGAAARAAGGFVLGFVNPVTLAVGAVAALGYAYDRGRQESRDFSNTLIQTGNAAGTTAGALADMARQVNQLGAGTVGRAAEVLNQLAGTGQVAAGNLQRFTDVALKASRAAGPAVEDTVKAFAELGKAPLQASLKLNDSMNYLTRSTYEQVRALEQQGRTIEAAQVAQKAYADALQQRTPQMEQNIGLLERAWRAVKDAAKGAADAALSVGRPLTDQQRLANLQSDLAARQEKNRSIGIKDGKATQDLQDEITLLSRRILREQEVAAAQVASNDQLKARADFDQQGLQYLTTREQLERAIVRVRNEGLAAGASEIEIQQRITQVRRQFDPGAGTALQVAAIDDTKRNLASLVAAYQNAESVLESNRQAGLIGEREYYDAKIGFLKLNGEAQRRILEEDVKAQRVLLQQPDLNTAERTAIQSRIKDDLAEIGRVQERVAVAGVNLATEQTSAQRTLAAAYEQSRSAAEDYLRTLTRANQRDLAGFGLGNEERSRLAGRNQIADKYEDDQRRLQSELRATSTRQGGSITDEQKDEYDKQVALIAEFKDKALAEYDDYYAKRRDQEADASYGASEAIRNYLDEQTNAARTVQQAYERTFSSLEDTLAEFFATGKLSVKSFVNTIIAELARIEAKKATASLVNSFGSLIASYFGGGVTVDTGGYGITSGGQTLPTAGGRAIGGPVSAGHTYQVNERDIPEIVRTGGKDYLTMGAQGGKVIPMGVGTGTNVTINVGAGVQRGELVALIPELTRQIKASIQSDMARPGGRS